MIRQKIYLLRRMRKINIHEDITRFELFNTNLKKIIQEQKRNYFFKTLEHQIANKNGDTLTIY